MQQNSELYHVGVLGMKWGQHKVRKLNDKIKTEKKIGKDSMAEDREIAAYRNKDATKAVARSKQIMDKNVSKLEVKRGKIQSKLDKRASKETQETIKKMQTGDAIVQSYLLGSYGSMVYNSASLKGVSTGQKLVKAVSNNWANNLTFGILSRTSRW